MAPDDRSRRRALARLGGERGARALPKPRRRVRTRPRGAGRRIGPGGRPACDARGARRNPFAHRGQQAAQQSRELALVDHLPAEQLPDRSRPGRSGPLELESAVPARAASRDQPGLESHHPPRDPALRLPAPSGPAAGRSLRDRSLDGVRGHRAHAARLAELEPRRELAARRRADLGLPHRQLRLHRAGALPGRAPPSSRATSRRSGSSACCSRTGGPSGAAAATTRRR